MILTLSLAADTFNEEVIIVLVKKSMPDIWDPEYKPTKKDKLPKKPKDASQNEEVPFGFGRTTAKPPARLNVATRNDVDKAAGLAAKFEDFFHNLKLKYSDDGVPESSLNIMFDELANLHVSLAKSINDKDLEDEGDKILDALEPALFSGAFVIFDDPRLKVIQGECNDFLDKYRSAISSIPLRQRDKRSLVRKFFSFNDVALQVAGAAGLVSAAGALALAQHKLVGASVSVLSDRMADVITKRFIKVSKAISEVPRLDIRLDKAEQSTWASAPVGGVLYPLAKMLLAAVAGAGATYSIMADRLTAESEARGASKVSEANKENEVSAKQQSSDDENKRLRVELEEASKMSVSELREYNQALQKRDTDIENCNLALVKGVHELAACQALHKQASEKSGGGADMQLKSTLQGELTQCRNDLSTKNNESDQTLRELAAYNEKFKKHEQEYNTEKQQLLSKNNELESQLRHIMSFADAKHDHTMRQELENQLALLTTEKNIYDANIRTQLITGLHHIQEHTTQVNAHYEYIINKQNQDRLDINKELLTTQHELQKTGLLLEECKSKEDHRDEDMDQLDETELNDLRTQLEHAIRQNQQLQEDKQELQLLSENGRVNTFNELESKLKNANTTNQQLLVSPPAPPSAPRA